MKNLFILVLFSLSFITYKTANAQTCHAGQVSVLNDTVCQGTSASLTVKGSTGNIQWQSATNNTFTNISGANDSIYTTIPLQQTTLFRVVVSKGSCSDTSFALKVFVSNPDNTLFTWSYVDTIIIAFNSDSSTGIINRYHWDFGDGDTSNIKNPIHTYTKDTTHFVCLTLYDSSSCSYTVCKFVYGIGPPPPCYPAFSFSYAGDTVYFKATVANQRNYDWTFGDGTFDDYGYNPSTYHVYDSTKTYSACLSVEFDPAYWCTECHDVSAISAIIGHAGAIDHLWPVSVDHIRPDKFDHTK